MAWGNGCLGLTALAGAMLVAGCTQTTQVDENVTTASLNQTKKAVAVMRVGAASPYCINVAVLLGVREGEGFRRHQGITVMNVRSLTEPAVAEVELDPGEYHVLAYRCQTQGRHQDGVRQRRRPAALPHQLRELRAAARRDRQRRLPARRGLARWPQHLRPADVEMEIEVTDWPLAELDRFKAKRPHIYAQMKTRLMTVTPAGQGPPTGQDCARLKALQGRGQGAGAAARVLPADGAKKARRPQLPSRAAISKPAADTSPSPGAARPHGRPPPDQCRDMTEVRAEIDRIDKALVDMIAERFGYVERAWQLKLEARQEANVPWRNQQVFDKVRARAEREGPAARPHRGAVAADGRLVHPARGGEAARPARGQARAADGRELPVPRAR